MPTYLFFRLPAEDVSLAKRYAGSVENVAGLTRRFPPDWTGQWLREQGGGKMSRGKMAGGKMVSLRLRFETELDADGFQRGLAGVQEMLMGVGDGAGRMGRSTAMRFVIAYYRRALEVARKTQRREPAADATQRQEPETAIGGTRW